jgi:uncharacterized RDD family membrane protein YckC
MTLRLIKYFVNIIILYVLIWVLAYLPFAIYTRLPDCGIVTEVIFNIIVDVLPYQIISLIIISFLNFSFERKLEKRKFTKEFILLTVIHLIGLFLAVLYFSNEFYKLCVK